MRLRAALVVVAAVPLLACGPSAREKEAALAAFTTVQQVFQHPRCQNCHIPGDAPLQFDQGLPHAQNILRGPGGMGVAGLPCASCHGSANLPASYGPNAPPGAPNWHLPPPGQEMVFIDLSPAELCEAIKDPARNGSRDMEAMLRHVAQDALVLWGWSPGGDRAPVPVPHDSFVAAFETWADAGAPCPGG